MKKNKQLTRIYGITFPKQGELTEHMEMLEEAKKRDHRKLGKELGLFTFSLKKLVKDCLCGFQMVLH